MKIENNQRNNNIKLKEIEIGETFTFDNILYVKIDNGYIRVETAFSCLALNLENNKLNSISENVLVKPVRAKIVIE